MSNKITSIFKSEHAIGALYIALLAGAIANALPDPTDALNFHLDRKLRIELEKGELSPENYWERKSLLYYGLDSIWWLMVLLVVVFFGKNIEQKAWLAGGVIGGGAVIGIIANNIKEDTKFWEKYKLVER